MVPVYSGTDESVPDQTDEEYQHVHHYQDPLILVGGEYVILDHRYIIFVVDAVIIRAIRVAEIHTICTEQKIALFLRFLLIDS